MNKTLVLSLSALALLAAGCQGQAPETENDGAEEKPYAVIEAETRTVTLTVKYPATLRGRQDIAVYPRMEGKIVAVHVTEGQRVKAGQRLFTIDPVPFRAALATARANMRAARAKAAAAELTLKSKRELKKRNVVSDFAVAQADIELESARAELDQARAALDNAEHDLSHTEVKSPTAGVVGDLPHKIGALVSSSMSRPLTVVSDNAEMAAHFALNERELAGLLRRHGSREKALEAMPPVRWEMSDGGVHEGPGRVATISGILDEATGTVNARAIFDNASGLLISGAAGNILMPLTLEDAVVIPQSCASELQDRLIVHRIKDGKAEMTRIRVHPLNDGKHYIVTEGLAAGDKIRAN